MITVSDLAYTYPRQKRIAFPSFQVESGSHWLLVGESGCGKTTLLHLMGGLLKTQEGAVRINSTDLALLSESQCDHFRGKHFGFVFQRSHLMQSLTVIENLLMAPYLADLKQDRNRAEYLLSRLGLSDKKKSKVSELSQGQVQRVAIARSVMNKPVVLLADEPTSALDDTHCHAVLELLLEMADENRSSLIVATHDHRLKNRIPNQLKL